MKKIIMLLVLALGALAVIPGRVTAQEATATPEANASSVSWLEQIDYTPRLLPTSPFYFLKQFKERLELALAKTPEQKVVKRLEIANRRLVELKAVAKKKPEMAEKLAKRYQQQLELLNREVSQLPEQEREQLVEHIGEVTLKHQSILMDVYQKVPEQGKKGIETAIEKSLSGHKEAIEAVSKEKQAEVEGKILEKKEKVIRKWEKLERAIKKDEDENDDGETEVLQKAYRELKEKMPVKLEVGNTSAGKTIKVELRQMPANK